MPKRIVDGDGLWRSLKLKRVEPPRFRAEFANLLPLALANGTFEADAFLIWAQAFAYNRPDVTPDDVVAMLDQFEKAKMLFRWQAVDGKCWGFWIDIDKPGRLPPPSERNREKRGPEPPADKLREFLGGSYPTPRQELGGGSLGIGTGNGTGMGKGNCNGNGTGREHGQQPQQSKTGSVSDLSQRQIKSPVSASDQVTGQAQSEPNPTLEPVAAAIQKPGLADIRDWNEDRFGISGERLRNCILYQLDHSPNDWYRKKADITLSKMSKEGFVAKLNADTKLGWTPENASAKTTQKPTDSGISKAAQEMVAKFGGKINE